MKRLFAQAAECAPDAREHLLADAPAEVRQEVSRLLRFSEVTEAALDRPAVSQPILPVRSLAPDTLLEGRYRVGKFLGAGGMGEVYAARDQHLGEDIAVKVLRPELAGDANLRARFRREMQLLRRVGHANVCRVFDLGAEGDFVFITMELLEGQTLAAWLSERGAVTPPEAWPLVEQMLLGLEAIHAAGIVHRDFKPGNVMLVGARVVITDLGIARELQVDDSASGFATSTGVAMGTPLYMAPELVAGQPATRQSDLYALGVVLYEMMTGRPIYAGATPLSILARKLREAAPSPREAAPDLDSRWEAAISRCLALEPADRFRNAAEIAALLHPHAPLWSLLKERAGAWFRSGRRGWVLKPAPVLGGLLTLGIAAGAWYAYRAQATYEPAAAAAAAYQEGRTARQLGALEEARQKLERALQLDSAFDRASAELAAVYHDLDWPDRARDQLLQLEDRSLWPRDGAYVRAVRSYVTQDYRSAAQAWAAVAAAASGDGRRDALFDQVVAEERAGRTAEALRGLEQIVRLEPAFAPALARRAVLTERERGYAAAKAHFDRAEAALETRVEARLRLRLLRAEAMQHGRDLAASLAEADAVVAESRAQKAAAIEVAALFHRGAILLALGRSGEARTAENEALDRAAAEGLEPLIARGLNDLGQAHLTQYEFEESRRLFRQAETLGLRFRLPRSVARSRLGLATIASRREPAAALAMLRPLGADVAILGDADLRQLLHAVSFDTNSYLGQHADAQRHGEALLALAVDRGNRFQQAQAKERLATTAFMAGDPVAAARRYAEASVSYREAGRLPHHVYALGNQAEMLLEAGHVPAARRVLDSAAATARTFPRAEASMGERLAILETQVLLAENRPREAAALISALRPETNTRRTQCAMFEALAWARAGQLARARQRIAAAEELARQAPAKWAPVYVRLPFVRAEIDFLENRCPQALRWTQVGQERARETGAVPYQTQQHRWVAVCLERTSP